MLINRASLKNIDFVDTTQFAGLNTQQAIEKAIQDPMWFAQLGMKQSFLRPLMTQAQKQDLKQAILAYADANQLGFSYNVIGLLGFYPKGGLLSGTSQSKIQLADFTKATVCFPMSSTKQDSVTELRALLVKLTALMSQLDIKSSST